MAVATVEREVEGILTEQRSIGMKRIILTGATSGLGLAAAKALSQQNHHLIIACRNMTKGEEVLKALKKLAPNSKIELFQVDLSDLTSIETFISRINESFDSIDVLINNAGVFSERKHFTKDLYELTIGTNYIGTFALTYGLIPLLKKSTDSRILNIVSRAGLYGKINITKDLFTKANKGFPPYANSKFAEILFSIKLSEELEADHINVNAVHPGKVDTSIMIGDTFMMKLMNRMTKKKLISPEEGAQIIIDVATSDDYKNMTGKMIESEGVIEYNNRCLDVDLRDSLHAFTMKALENKIIK